MKISKELRDKIASLVPEGYDVSDLRIASSTAQVQALSEVDPAAQLAIAKAQKQAGAPLFNSEGQPTILRIVSWVGHADMPNKNGDAFVREELESISSSLFRSPNFGVMDFNHSAVRPWSDDPKVIGIWYKAEWAFDQSANAGKGAWGILATGIMYSWLFPEIADKLLADQARTGSVKVSWTWIPGSIEMKEDARGSFNLNHNPVFFTVSVLDVPPADPDAQGAATEDPTVTEDDLRQQVAVAERIARFVGTAGANGLWMPALRAASVEGTRMNEELKQQLEAAKAEAKQQVEKIAAEYVSKENELKAKVAESEKTIADLTKAKEELEIKVAELTTARTVATGELEKAAGELEKAAGRIAELEATNKDLTEKLVSFEAEKAEAKRLAAEAAKQVRLQNRIAALPESYRKAHQSRDESTRTRVEAKWAEMSDDEWTKYVQDEIAIVSTSKANYTIRSAAEGLLPAQAEPEADDIKARVKRLLK